MLDVHLLRNDLAAVVEGLGKRGVTFDAARFESLERERKDIQTRTQELQAKRNALSKQIGQIKGKGGDASVLMAEVAGIPDQLKALEAKLVDRVGYLADVLDEAKSRAKIAKAKVVMFSRRPARLDNPYSGTPSAQSFGTGDLEQARKLLGFHCYYLWEPYLLGK